MCSISEKTESEVSSIIESEDSDVEEIKEQKLWNRKDYFVITNDRYKCKSCDKPYNKLISGNILRNHYIKSSKSC